MRSGSFRSRSKGPPGMSRIKKNVMLTTQNKITTNPSIRFAMNQIIRNRGYGKQCERRMTNDKLGVSSTQPGKPLLTVLSRTGAGGTLDLPDSACVDRRLPRTSPDVATPECLDLNRMIETPVGHSRVETFPGAACCTTLGSAKTFCAIVRWVRQHSKAAPLQALGENDHHLSFVICNLSFCSAHPLPIPSVLRYIAPVTSNRVFHLAVSVPDSLAASCKLEASVALSRS